MNTLGDTIVLLFTEFDSFNFHVSWFLTGSKVSLTTFGIVSCNFLQGTKKDKCD